MCDFDTAIVVGTNGFVWVAAKVTTDGQFYYLANARQIRRWGTSKGLNELTNGPTKDTVLDASAELVALTSNALIAIIPCREEKWAGNL